MRALVLVAALLVAGCHQGNGLSAGDLSTPEDMTTPPDLQPPPDMVPPPNCGKIAFCAITCGTQNLTCLGGCFQNAPPMALQEAGTLVACAAQNCLQADGGMLQLFQCLSDKCPMQLAGCEGLGLGGGS
jgi:hypothetical protein